MTRVDGRLKVTGQARYAADNPAPEHGVRGAGDAAPSRAAPSTASTPRPRSEQPDVLRVLTDFGGVKLPYDIRQVSCFGQPVAIVVATTLEAAIHGAVAGGGALPTRRRS